MHHYLRTLTERELSEETVDRLRDLETQLTGTMTTRIESRARVTDAPVGPRMPSWWRGDEEASTSGVLAMNQLGR